ncbi:MAG: imidazole glycerol phosphate synthase subunit HisH [Rhodobacteraceae bacterium]|jgi:glutamine amidotransferase|nr:imidazole glycerol phosphate synthase subunit HisH [Paracoccaceae bacterium]
MSHQPSVGLIHYQAGNIKSLRSAFDWFNVAVRIVESADDFDGLTHVVLPGVGAFGHCADQLRASPAMDRLQDWVRVEKRPLLGVCVGMQLLAAESEEFGHHAGLGWLGGRVTRLRTNDPAIRVPHVGWNTVTVAQPFCGYDVGQTDDYYFDHSFAYEDLSAAHVLGTCTHGRSFPAIVGAGNILAAQCHPEKSQKTGLLLIERFLQMGAA